MSARSVSGRSISHRMAGRRGFLRTATAGGLALAAWPLPAFQASAAADRITIGVIGCKRGYTVAKDLVKQNVHIAYLCDPDEANLKKAQAAIKPDQGVRDLRRILDDRAVDAVVVAAPDHWHAGAAILACQAGKHVYVEKPCSHNIHEGRKMIEAARRANRVMQVGSQSRSTAALRAGIDLLHAGAIGEILVAKCWTCQRRPNIGHLQPSDPPKGVDYDLWVGPAEMVPFQANRFHYMWHWWYNFGTGDAGNRGVHEMDIALWAMQIDTHPAKAVGTCGKLFFDDDQQFPDTQYVTFEYPAAGNKPRRLLVYEQRIWSPSLQDDLGDANAFYGPEGYMVLSKHTGWKLYDANRKLVKQQTGLYSVPEHTADFLDAIRTGRRPNADIEIGHRSATLAHLANILARTGRSTLTFDPQTETFPDAPDANALLRRAYRPGHWAAVQG